MFIKTFERESEYKQIFLIFRIPAKASSLLCSSSFLSYQELVLECVSSICTWECITTPSLRGLFII